MPKILNTPPGWLAALLVAITLALNSNGAKAATVTNSWPFDPPLNNWTDQTFSVPQFDPSNGTLRNVQLTLNMQTDGTIRIRNSCPQRKTITFAYSNSFVLRVLDTKYDANTESRTSLALGPGEVSDLGSQSKRRTVTFDIPEAGRLGFLGDGTTSIRLARSGSVIATCSEGGCGCVSASIISFDVRGEVSVIYTFEPPPPRINWERAENGLDLLLSWQIHEGFIYVLETSTGFNNWSPISTNAAPTTIAREQVAIGADAERFFRLRRATVAAP